MTSSPEDRGLEQLRGYNDRPPMLELLRYCTRFGWRLTGGIIASFLTRVARLVPPIVVAVAIDRVIDAPGNPGLLARVGLLTDRVIPASEMGLRQSLLFQLVVIAVAAYLVRALTRFLSRYWLQSTAQKVQRDLRDDAYRHLQTLSLNFFDRHESGSIMSVLNNDINQLEEFLNSEIDQMTRVVAIVLVIGSVMFYVYPKMALIALVPVPLIGLASGGFLVWIDRKYRRIRETVSRLNSRLANNLGGIKVIKAFNREGHEASRVARQSDDYHDRHVAAIRIRRAYFSFLRLSTGVVFVAILYIGGHDVLSGHITIGTFTLFFLFLRRLYGPMRRIGRTANKYQLAKASAERVFGLLSISASLKSPEDPVDPGEVEGRVEFEDVSFRYPSSKAGFVLREVSTRVEPGDTIGLVGETGAGKSTFLKLIPRFYDVQRGTVRVDGVDVRDYDLSALRDHIALVDQDPFLFSGTVLANIAYGDRTLATRAVMDQQGLARDARERIADAARAAEAHGFIERLPDGYGTEVGERGVRLSGGQRQRITIARALLNDPEIILFDEATSDVDSATEILIQRSLKRLCRDRTALIVAHRLSTVIHADRILVLDGGRIVERGTHRELLDRGEHYADLWEAQTDDDGERQVQDPSFPADEGRELSR